MGLAFLYLTITLCFSVFVSFMQQVGRLCSWIMRAVLASWALAAVQSIAVAFLVGTANTGTSLQVAIVSLVVLALYLFVLVVAVLYAIKVFMLGTATATPSDADIAARAAGAVGGVATGSAAVAVGVAYAGDRKLPIGRALRRFGSYTLGRRG